MVASYHHKLWFRGEWNSKVHYCVHNPDEVHYSDESYKSISGLNKKFSNTYRFCNEDVNKFVLLLRKGVYSYEYMDNWGKIKKLQYQIKKLFTVN